MTKDSLAGPKRRYSRTNAFDHPCEFKSRHVGKRRGYEALHQASTKFPVEGIDACRMDTDQHFALPRHGLRDLFEVKLSGIAIGMNVYCTHGCHENIPLSFHVNKQMNAVQFLQGARTRARTRPAICQKMQDNSRSLLSSCSTYKKSFLCLRHSFPPRYIVYRHCIFGAKQIR